MPDRRPAARRPLAFPPAQRRLAAVDRRPLTLWAPGFWLQALPKPKAQSPKPKARDLRSLINRCRFIDVRQASTLYRLLGDEARLRLLRVLRRERLDVTQLTGILGLAQSGVSRHLGLLKDAGLVIEETDAGYTSYL